MGRKKKKEPRYYENLEVVAAGSEGKCVARPEGKVVMLDYAVPGDVVDARVIQEKRRFEMAVITRLVQASPDRAETFCTHFGTCGGCKWQQMTYSAQLKYKQQQVQDAFERIGKFPFPTIEPILGSNPVTQYRNKVEFSFTDRKWLEDIADIGTLSPTDNAGLGYHIPGRFDKVFDLETCHLMPPLNDRIRTHVRNFCKENEYDFYNLYGQTGLMRNMMLRCNKRGEWMLIISFGREDQDKRLALLDSLAAAFPEITALFYVINEKKNDSLYDLDIQLYKGNGFLIEELEDLKFKIGPKSFFQTNAYQTLELYRKAREFAGLTGTELVYDLYTGVGTIALFISKMAAHVVGLEYVEQAIEDARENAALNQITHCSFHAGDMKDLLTLDFVAEHGKPDVVITDPPRAGMHEDVIARLLEMEPQKIVYVSCNPSTQARDIALLCEKYDVTRVQPVDMFPHTHHVENIALLERKA